MQWTTTRGARPQVQVLLIALAVTVILWFIPFLDLLAYPFRLFVTFIHESGHALAALVTGNRVHSLAVDPNGGGFVIHSGGNWLERMFVSSAGYLGAMGYGTLLLVLIRRSVSPRVILYASAIPILVLSLVYGWGTPFTIVAGVLLAAALFAVGRFARPAIAGFLVALLAVQCIVNALFDLRTLLFLSNPLAGGARTDAQNMADITRLPAIFWALVWSIMAVVMLYGALRLYVGKDGDLPDPIPTSSRRRRSRSTPSYDDFNDTPPSPRAVPRPPRETPPWPPASERG
jgi:hypothetical protein